MKRFSFLSLLALLLLPRPACSAMIARTGVGENAVSGGITVLPSNAVNTNPEGRSLQAWSGGSLSGSLVLKQAPVVVGPNIHAVTVAPALILPKTAVPGDAFATQEPAQNAAATARIFPASRDVAPAPRNDLEETASAVAADDTAAPGTLDQAFDGKADKKELLIIGHAGSPDKEAENTLPGFEQAVRDGANGIETDLSMTADGQIVHWHDWSPNNIIALARQLGLQGFKYKPMAPSLGSKHRKPVPDMTLEELRREYGYALNTPLFPGRSDYQIPTFEEFARWAASKKELQFVYLDVKIPKREVGRVPFFLDQLHETAARYGIADKLVFFSPYRRIAKAAAAYAAAKGYGLKIGLDRNPPLFTIMLQRGKTTAPQATFAEKALDRIVQFISSILRAMIRCRLFIFPRWSYSVVNDAAKLGLPFASMGRPIINGWHVYKKIVDHNLLLKLPYPAFNFLTWTINAEDEIRWLLERGVNGIVTDHPERVRAARASPRQS